MQKTVGCNDGSITCLDVEKRGLRFDSELGIFTERLIDGRLVCCDIRDNGIPVAEIYEQRGKPSFSLIVDGESVDFGWEWKNCSIGEAPSRNPKAVLELQHTHKPLRLRVLTECCGYGFFKRSMELLNTSESQTMGLSSMSSLNLALWPITDNIADILGDGTVSPFSIGYFKDDNWGYEGNFHWSDIPENTGLSVGSLKGRSGHNNPYIVLRNNIYGGYFICLLSWSANWEASARCIRPENFNVNKLRLDFSIGPVSPSPARLIAPGESIRTPEVHFGISHEDYDTAVQNLHRHLRGNVLRKSHDGIQPVIFNHWGYMEHEVSEERLKEEIDIAAELGGELFIVDAGWYADKSTPWPETTGNWYTGDRLPNDLFPVFAHAREKGLKYGLWMEIESAGSKSGLAQEHPDWFISRYGKAVDRILDLTKPEVKSYVESEIIRVIEKYKLELFRLDYNLDQGEGGFNLKDGKQENTLWRHVEAIYEIFGRVSEKYPAIHMDNCSSGGGRSDLGIVSRFTTTWVSDCLKMPRTVRILNGMTMMYPPEYVARMIGAAMSGSDRGNLETQLHVGVLSHLCFSGIGPGINQLNPAAVELLRKYIRIYKEFVRPMHGSMKVFHHTPEIAGIDGTGWCALEYASEDGNCAAAGVFRLVNTEKSVYRFKFKGIDEGNSFKVRILPEEKTFSISGYVLAYEGLDVRLDSALTSKLILVKAAQNEVNIVSSMDSNPR